MSFFPQPGGVPQQLLLREKESPQLCQGVLDLDKGLRVGNFLTYTDGQTINYRDVMMGNIALRRDPPKPVANPPVVVPIDDVIDYLKCSYSADLYINGMSTRSINHLSIFTQPYLAALNAAEPIVVQNYIPWYNISASEDPVLPRISFVANYDPPILQDGYLLPDTQPLLIFMRFLIIKSIPIPIPIAEKKEEPKNINPRAIRG